MDRRHFIMSSAAASIAVRPHMLASANDTVRVACIGFNNFGRTHIASYLALPNVEVAALCDVDESVLARGMKMVEAAGKKRPAAFTDYRKVLDDKSIDAVSIATPNHNHTMQAVWGCQAGKDVYVEKPCSHNMFEAQQIVAAARKHNRIVQHGTGASIVLHEAKRRLQEGVIGDLYMARGLCFKLRDTIGRAPEEPVPPGVNYDLWLGPAPKRPFTRNRFHYTFHWFWEYGNGDFGNQGCHQLHAARWALGVRYPTKVTATGGHFLFDDDQETPNTMVVTFEFNEGGKKKMLVFEVRGGLTNPEAGIVEKADAASGPAAGTVQTVGDIYYGSNGYLILDRTTWKTFLGKKQEPGPTGAPQEESAFANFIGAVRSRRREEQRAEIEEGAITTVLVHLGNISYRLGRSLNFDAKTMTCIGDVEANAMFRRQYRAPFVVPERV